VTFLACDQPARGLGASKLARRAVTACRGSEKRGQKASYLWLFPPVVRPMSRLPASVHVVACAAAARTASPPHADKMPA
jgi:hypothetical protein